MHRAARWFSGGEYLAPKEASRTLARCGGCSRRGEREGCSQDGCRGMGCPAASGASSRLTAPLFIALGFRGDLRDRAAMLHPSLASLLPSLHPLVASAFSFSSFVCTDIILDIFFYFFGRNGCFVRLNRRGDAVCPRRVCFSRGNAILVGPSA